MVTDRLPADREGCDLDILMSTERKCGLANGISLVSFTVTGTCHPFTMFIVCGMYTQQVLERHVGNSLVF